MLSTERQQQSLDFIAQYEAIQHNGETLLAFYNPGLLILLLLLGLYIVVAIYREKKGKTKGKFATEWAVSIVILYHLFFIVLILVQTVQVNNWKERVASDYIYTLEQKKWEVLAYAPVEGKKSTKYLTGPFVEKQGGMDEFEKMELTGFRNNKKTVKTLTVKVKPDKQVKTPVLVYKKLKGPLLDVSSDKTHHSKKMFGNGYYDALLLVPLEETKK